MSEQQGNQSTSDEIDLGQLFRLVGKGFDSLFRGILRIFLYFKRNFYWLAGLLIVGVVLGLVLRLALVQKQKLDVIVTPNMNSKEYLQDVVDELQSIIKSKDTAALATLGMDITKIEGFEIELIPLRNRVDENNPAEMEFLESLKEFENSEAIADIIRSELQERTTRDHRITFYFKDARIGAEYSEKILNYINSNNYYSELNNTYRKNAEIRMRKNDSLIRQIDLLVERYSEKMSREQQGSEGRLILDTEQALDVPSLLTLKNRLEQENENKRLELVIRQDPIKVINFGKAHVIQKPFYGKNIVLAPVVLVGGFLLISLLGFLNRKASELK
ncbi:hypothetical protein [Robiginitalea sp. SC105]|uniref:hypothetical protein n=1 Tax=Robiginitalea sp. SC105 TaxID=2762332 RepID=UPI00163AC09B|nr:hypothetical protein [Robiginitalea sp. SC105]MBC2838226.1 hypothetical protein [Robiginitalea sp. SC105]